VKSCQRLSILNTKFDLDMTFNHRQIIIYEAKLIAVTHCFISRSSILKFDLNNLLKMVKLCQLQIFLYKTEPMQVTIAVTHCFIGRTYILKLELSNSQKLWNYVKYKFSFTRLNLGMALTIDLTHCFIGRT
jgi:hypothetical protein